MLLLCISANYYLFPFLTNDAAADDDLVLLLLLPRLIGVAVRWLVFTGEVEGEHRGWERTGTLASPRFSKDSLEWF